MIPQRHAYALKRIARLTERLERINAAIAVRAHSGHPEDVRTRQLLYKDRNSTVNSINRWQKELDKDR
jgi:hypothetical protein